jgi:hypothetical protein
MYSRSWLVREHWIILISIFAQVNITNPSTWLVKFDVLSCYKTEIFKMAASRFVEVYW